MKARKVLKRIIAVLAVVLLFENAYSQNDCIVPSTVSFVGHSVRLSPAARESLVAVALDIKDHPECKVVVKGYCASSKRSQQLSWDRVNTVIIYLIEKEGLRSERLIFKYGEEEGDCNTVDIKTATPDEAQNSYTPPAPFPNLRRRG